MKEPPFTRQLSTSLVLRGMTCSALNSLLWTSRFGRICLPFSCRPSSSFFFTLPASSAHMHKHTHTHTTHSFLSLRFKGAFLFFLVVVGFYKSRDMSYPTTERDLGWIGRDDTVDEWARRPSNEISRWGQETVLVVCIAFWEAGCGLVAREGVCEGFPEGMDDDGLLPCNDML